MLTNIANNFYTRQTANETSVKVAAEKWIVVEKERRDKLIKSWANAKWQ